MFIFLQLDTSSESSYHQLHSVTETPPSNHTLSNNNYYNTLLRLTMHDHRKFLLPIFHQNKLNSL